MKPSASEFAEVVDFGGGVVIEELDGDRTGVVSVAFDMLRAYRPRPRTPPSSCQLMTRLMPGPFDFDLCGQQNWSWPKSRTGVARR